LKLSKPLGYEFLSLAFLILNYKTQTEKTFNYDENNRVERYSYNNKNQLTKFERSDKNRDKSVGNGVVNYSYDKQGNLTKESYSNTNTTPTKLERSDKSRYKSVENDVVNYSYDKQGNLTKESYSNSNTTPTPETLYTYNLFNQAEKVITKEGDVLVNRYDAEGLRYEIEENNKLTKFIFKDDNLLLELDKDDKLISRFTRGYEEKVVSSTLGHMENIEEALEENAYTKTLTEDAYLADYLYETKYLPMLKELKEQNKYQKLYYYIQDEQGSTDTIVSENEKCINHYDYEAFGDMLESQEVIHNRIKYTGEQHDNLTNQYYLRARFYNPVLGRFIQEDTYRGDGLNLYAYCDNNPVMYYDPSGYSKINCTKNAIKGGGNVTSVNPNDVRFSQSSVNGANEITRSMKSNGWEGDPIDVVRMVDGKLTTLDNTRVVSARKSGINVRAKIHSSNDILPNKYIKRFTRNKRIPKTWGEAVEIRIQKQNGRFRNNNPLGTFELPKIN
jgi:RHS repeat-associated protein